MSELNKKGINTDFLIEEHRELSEEKDRLKEILEKEYGHSDWRSFIRYLFKRHKMLQKIEEKR